LSKGEVGHDGVIARDREMIGLCHLATILIIANVPYCEEFAIVVTRAQGDRHPRAPRASVAELEPIQASGAETQLRSQDVREHAGCWTTASRRGSSATVTGVSRQAISSIREHGTGAEKALAHLGVYRMLSPLLTTALICYLGQDPQLIAWFEKRSSVRPFSWSQRLLESRESRNDSQRCRTIKT
jgi:hypothetical protein